MNRAITVAAHHPAAGATPRRSRSNATDDAASLKRPGRGGGTDSIEIRLAQRKWPFGSAEVIGRAERRSGAHALPMFSGQTPRGILGGVG